jgi:uncharacterized protein (DUF302 family)
LTDDDPPPRSQDLGDDLDQTPDHVVRRAVRAASRGGDSLGQTRLAAVRQRWQNDSKEHSMTDLRQTPDVYGAVADRVVTKLSPWSVGDTVARLSAVVTARGMKVFAVIDHSGEAEAAGLKLRDTKLVIFGSPTAGTPVMVSAPLAALDLPLKVLVWKDEHTTKLSYTAPGALAARYGLSADLASRLAGIDGVTDVVIDR